jgi:hypothetical protein
LITLNGIIGDSRRSRKIFNPFAGGGVEAFKVVYFLVSLYANREAGGIEQK